MLGVKLFIFIKTLSNSICSTIVFTRKLLKSCSSLSVTVKKKKKKKNEIHHSTMETVVTVVLKFINAVNPKESSNLLSDRQETFKK